jgi:oligopeptide transport system ATP-binding protein
MALILITHDLGVLAGIADRILVMYAGRVVETAPTGELFANPCHPYTAGLLSSVPRLDAARVARLAPIRGQPPDLIDLPEGCPFAPRCDYAQETCRQKAPPLLEVQPGHRAACWYWESVGKEGPRG